MLKHRKLIQVLTLIAFIVLIVLGKIQIWMIIFLAGLFLSTFMGRFYCGYICPINTAMEVIDDNADKKKRKRIETPNWMKDSIIRFGILILFLGTMGIVFNTGKKPPVLPILFGLGVILTIFFEPSLWHKYLCPFGTLLSVFSKRNKKGYRVNDLGCIQCGKCISGCPGDAIYWKDKKKDPIINIKDCLVCGKCERVCPKDVIEYI